jgi:hypothetical protein
MVVIAVLGCLLTIRYVLSNVVIGYLNVVLDLVLVWDQNIIDLYMGRINLSLGTVDLSLVCGSLCLTVSLISRVLLIRLVLGKIQLIYNLIEKFNDLLNGSTSGKLEVNGVQKHFAVESVVNLRKSGTCSVVVELLFAHKSIRASKETENKHERFHFNITKPQFDIRCKG